jgi:hypothetical protein
MPWVGFERVWGVEHTSRSFQSVTDIYPPPPKKTYQLFLYPPAHTCPRLRIHPNDFCNKTKVFSYIKSNHVYCTWSIPGQTAAVREMEVREWSRRCRLRYQWPRVMPEVAVKTCGQIHVTALSKTRSKAQTIRLLIATVADQRRAACDVRIVFRTGLM